MDDRDRRELERRLELARDHFDEAVDPVTKNRILEFIREVEDQLQQKNSVR